MKKLYLVICLFFISLPLFCQNLIVQDIQAKATKGTKINISWTLPKDTKDIKMFYLYRNTKPITTFSQISESTFISEISPDATGFVDSVKDYNDYYYALITFTDKPYDIILVSANSTAIGVHLFPPKKDKNTSSKQKEEKLYTNGTKRETPLPYLNLLDGMEKENQVISNDVAKSTTQFSASQKETESKEVIPFYFEADLVSPDGGDDYLLFEILKNTFVQEKYEEAIEQLNKLVKRNINENVQNRAYFYIGESEYFTGNYENALRYFIQVSNIYPDQAKKWIYASVDKLQISE